MEPGLEDLTKLTELFKSKFRSILWFGMLNLTYLTLVGHLNKVWSVILQSALVAHIESVVL